MKVYIVIGHQYSVNNSPYEEVISVHTDEDAAERQARITNHNTKNSWGSYRVVESYIED